MARQRKTIDTWQIHVNYGDGWEHDCTEFSLLLAKQQKRTYLENCPQYPVRIVQKREKRSGFTQNDLDGIQREVDKARLLWERTRKFNAYVYSFYGCDSDLYPMGATKSQIAAATQKLLARKTHVEFDSFDRESVRDILINEFGLEAPQYS